MTLQGFLEVHIPGGNSERHELVATRSLVGTGAESAVRVSHASKFADVELELQLGPKSVRVRAVQAAQPFIFQGEPVATAEVPWGEEVFAKGVRLTFLAAKARQSPISPVLLFVAPLVLLICGLVTFQSLQEHDTPTREVEAPPLIEKDRPCRQSTAAEAEHDAREAEHAALAKAERFPFEARDGVDAANLLVEARACFATAGRETERLRVEVELEQWSERLGQRYSALQLRLRVALDNDRPRDVLEACQGLEALLASRPESAYRQWLATMRRQVEAKLARTQG